MTEDTLLEFLDSILAAMEDGELTQLDVLEAAAGALGVEFTAENLPKKLGKAVRREARQAIARDRVILGEDDFEASDVPLARWAVARLFR